ncbi:MAG: adventurous gliding motility protein CglF [Myxococcota bacterium]
MMNTKVMLGAVLLALLMLICAAAMAEEAAPQTPPAGGDQQTTIYKKKTVYDFEDDTITGDLTRPDGEYIDARRKVKHQNLIRIREDFKEKVLGSVSRI